ncbi:MAG: lysophospholipid acyltransferase family protein [Pseudomonadota bacterium]
MKRPLPTQIRYALEALGLSILLLIFKIMPAHWASNIGGWVGRNIGSRLAASRKARRNLERALPDLSEQRKDEIIAGMWDNLGRVMAEYPHLETLALDYTDIEGEEHMRIGLENPRGAIFFGAHFGNWEINTIAALTQFDEKVAPTYRAPNNPWSDKLLMRTRTLNGTLDAHSKSRQGGKGMIDDLKAGKSLGILIDQKYNEGVSVPFFGLEAMTNPFFVQLAQKYKASLVPLCNRRLDNGRFSLTFYPALEVMNKDCSARAVDEVIKDAHSLLEEWIEDKPEQWLWLHRRWKDDV